MNLSVSLQLLDLGQSAGLLGRVISTSQGLCLYTQHKQRAKTVHALDYSATLTGKGKAVPVQAVEALRVVRG
jgi:hypothetical protein